MSLRHCVLLQTPGFKAGLTYYGAHETQALHWHGHHQVSFLLSGELREGNARRRQEILFPSVGVKPAGFPHDNCYGPHGALIFALDIDQDSDLRALGLDLSGWRWRAEHDDRARRILRDKLAALVRGAPGNTEDSLWDLMSAITTPPAATTRRPAWLLRTRDAMRDTDAVDMRTLAREAGVHPVHLSRTFSNAFGCAPTVYRAQCRFARALAAMAAGDPAADAAAAAGFSDQSHLSRQARRETGLTPRQLQAIVAARG